MTKFNFNTRHIVSTVYPTDKCNITANFCIIGMATVVWNVSVDEVCDLKQGKQVLTDREENFDDYDEETRSWYVVERKL